MRKPIIRVQELSKIYKTKHAEVHALKNVHVTIYSGDRILIKGKSGSGKSTFINILGCMDSAYEGRYEFEGNDMKTLRKKEKAQFRNKNCGYIFQEYELIENLTVFDNVGIPLQYNHEINKKEKTEKIKEMLNKIGLSDKEKELVKNLSGGQRQRIAIARALINDPSVILADEATSSLDDDTAEEIMQLILSLMHDESILIFVGHHMKSIECFHRCLQMEDGRLTEMNIE